MKPRAERQAEGLSVEETAALIMLAEHTGTPGHDLVERLVALGLAAEAFGGQTLTADGRKLHEQLEATPHHPRRSRAGRPGQSPEED
ncbi:MAG: hypothetical protein ACRCVA_25180 [Phreatobacter sp.]